ncbi:MAG TPA: HEAT repeat domain-containing protein [Pyrinomonadaceae bacterium]|nr:HEAT repeat domain-containing protein [Pyrinomonadaceae bacterium]
MMRITIPLKRVSRDLCCSILLTAAMPPLVFAVRPFAAASFCYQNQQEPAWLQAQLEKEKLRLNSLEIEERRDAAMRLGALRRVEASRAVIPALTDPSPIVRVAAANAVWSLPAEESVPVLIPLLNDKDPFVRQEVAYALGGIHNRGAVAGLLERLNTDKEDGVRGAAAVALGMIRDEEAVVPLSQALSSSRPSARGARKRKTKENEFVLRAAARALGEIGSRAGVPALIEALSSDLLADDIKREAAQSLGRIADRSAIPSLRAATLGHDPHLSRIAFEALHKIELNEPKKPS